MGCNLYLFRTLSNVVILFTNSVSSATRTVLVLIIIRTSESFSIFPSHSYTLVIPDKRKLILSNISTQFCCSPGMMLTQAASLLDTSPPAICLATSLLGAVTKAMEKSSGCLLAAAIPVTEYSLDLVTLGTRFQAWRRICGINTNRVTVIYTLFSRYIWRPLLTLRLLHLTFNCKRIAFDLPQMYPTLEVVIMAWK